MAEKNRRLVLDNDIIFPITKQENVIGLQKTIKEKLPIVSETQPLQGFVEKQVWINVDNSTPNSENEVEINTNGIQLEHEPMVSHSQIEEPTGEIEEDDFESRLAEIEES